MTRLSHCGRAEQHGWNASSIIWALRLAGGRQQASPGEQALGALERLNDEATVAIDQRRGTRSIRRRRPPSSEFG